MAGIRNGAAKTGNVAEAGEDPTTIYISPPDSRGTTRVFYAYFYNHARRPRLEKLLCLELSRIPNGFF